MEELKSKIRDIPNFPKDGIIFKDITTLLQDADAFRKAVDVMYDAVKDLEVSKVLSIEARGFIFGGALAYLLGAGLVIARKPGKLPYKTLKASYELEYGTDTLEVHEDAIEPDDKVLILDDLLATGGTARAMVDLVKSVGAEVVGCCFLVELDFLNGRKKLEGTPVISLIHY
ncbi:MAG TPA: adenine phosphoribosyltransferase [Proteobacteria bacterium]|nr:adenine phosphoribosyltransferase [Pseudomonadota bacterium]